MINTLSVAQLETLLDQFTVPMFVIERHTAGTDFQMVGMNTALEELAGQPRAAILGRSVSDMAAAGITNDASEHYLRCVTTRTTTKFAYLFVHEDREARWDTTLQYAQSPEGYDRIIATAINLPEERPMLLDRLAFEDLRYFSSIADLQLENLNLAFSSVSNEIGLSPAEEERFLRLHVVCRTVQRSVSDIKTIVGRAQARHSGQNTETIPSDGSKPSPKQGMGTVRALADAWLDEQGQSIR